jgi:hypothetical protein
MWMRPNCRQEGFTTMNATETTTATQAAAAAEAGAPVAPKATKATRKATAKKGAPKAKKAAKAAKPATAKTSTKKAATAAVPREFSKKAVVLDLPRRKGGATMPEIMKATDWQPHSVRGFISGALGKKMGLAIESTKNSAGERCYKISGK